MIELSTLQFVGLTIAFVGGVLTAIGYNRRYGFTWLFSPGIGQTRNFFRRHFWEDWADEIQDPQSYPWLSVGYPICAGGFCIVTIGILHPIAIFFGFVPICAVGYVFYLAYFAER